MQNIDNCTKLIKKYVKLYKNMTNIKKIIV